jgi:uncharacterized repeat protein (TIGR03803 family)
MQTVKSIRLWTAASVVAVCVIAMLAAQSALAQTFTALYSFTGMPDGADPAASLVRDAAGNLYGTTFHGGTRGGMGCIGGCGTVFKVSKTGKETVLYRFNGTGDGSNPLASLVRDAAGNLYSTAAGGKGTVFEVDTTGKEKVLHRFKGGSNDGTYPEAGVLRDDKGTLYGTTTRGGTGAGCEPQGGCGLVFQLTKGGKVTPLHNFNGTGVDGTSPAGNLVRDAAWNLYGTTVFGGGTGCTGQGCGTVFKVSRTGNETVLYRFTGQPDGELPNGDLVRDSAGNLYGTTRQGGLGAGSGCPANLGCGTVFKLDTTGKETVLYRFCPGQGCTDGFYPNAGLVRDAAGNLYGTTSSGGVGYNAIGMVFKVDTSGQETVLYTFHGTDGGEPLAGLVMDSNGNLYGTASLGGAGGAGVVFKITP